MICTLYSHKTEVNKINELLKKNFPEGEFSESEQEEYKLIEVKLKGGFFGGASKIKISYRERIEPGFELSTSVYCPLNENLKGLYGFVASLPAADEKIGELLLQKIQTINSECSIFQEKGKTKQLKEFIQTLAKDMEAFLFVQADTIIAQGKGQHFLNENLDLIIDGSGNAQLEHLDINIESKYYDKLQVNLSADQQKRKTENELVLEQHEIKVNKNLPCIESEAETTIRTVKEIAERVTILTFTNAVAFNQLPGEKAIEVIKRYELWDMVTPKEREFLENPTEKQKSIETWKCEGIWTLMWALQIVNDLGFPNEMAELSKIPMEEYPLGNEKDPNEFIAKQTKTVAKAEIMNMNDRFYRMSWACVDLRLKGEEMKTVHPGVVYERHYALNWLINYQGAEWDDITCNT
ncbi:MAG: hypothetical protein ACI8ZM_004661 [Crocinitomix sp.]|jgi:hypothetical protein